ncbi:hypothetical protein NMY22_g10781 [Coprinellus aureogranulatus]|nr:hypothetical protein NMY22_g10781 [Coprinellus aureogranulatus]
MEEEGAKPVVWRLKEWFRWQMNPRSRNTGCTISKKDLHNIYSGRSRVAKPYKVFAKLYPDKIEAEKRDRCETQGIKGRQQITVWHEVAKEMYQDATSAELEAVRKELEGGEDSEGEGSPESPATYLRYLRKLPSLLDATVTPAVRKAGVLAFVTIVGPDPEQHGRIVTRTLQFGDKSTTPVFAKVWRDHDTVFVEELARFVRRHEFTPEVCAARSIHYVNQTAEVSAPSEDSKTHAEGTTPATNAQESDVKGTTSTQQAAGDGVTPTQIPTPTGDSGSVSSDDKDSVNHILFSRARAKPSRVMSDESEEEDEEDEDHTFGCQVDRESVTLPMKSWDELDDDWELDDSDPAMYQLEKDHRGPPHQFDINMASSPVPSDSEHPTKVGGSKKSTHSKEHGLPLGTQHTMATRSPAEQSLSPRDRAFFPAVTQQKTSKVSAASSKQAPTSGIPTLPLPPWLQSRCARSPETALGDPPASTFRIPNTRGDGDRPEATVPPPSSPSKNPIDGNFNPNRKLTDLRAPRTFLADPPASFLPQSIPTTPTLPSSQLPSSTAHLPPGDVRIDSPPLREPSPVHEHIFSSPAPQCGKKGRKAMLAAARLDPTITVVPNRIIDLSTLVQMLHKFIDDLGGKQTLSLPPTSKETRKNVHELALAFNLKSVSKGKGDARYVTVTKTTRTAPGRVDERKVARIIRKSGGPGARGNDFTSGSNPYKGGGGKVQVPRHKEGEVVGKAAPKIDATNVGFKMLAMMGWSEGERIGMDGLEAPIEAVIKHSKLGLGAMR